MLTLTTITLLALLLACSAAATRPERITTRIAETQVGLWRCQDQLARDRTRPSVDPWSLPRSSRYRTWVLDLWSARRKDCLRELHRVAAINRNLYRLAVCETGGINGGKPLWTHHNSVYSGALGFAHSTWAQFKLDGYPSQARHATPAQQMAVGRVLVALYGYTPWPACHRRLGIY